MMDKQTLSTRLTVSTTNKVILPDLVALGGDSHVSATQLHELCYNERNSRLAFRAAWVLEYIAAHHPDRFMPVFGEFVARFPLQQNQSCQRHFTKILMEITQPKAPESYRQAFMQVDRELLVETVFGWLIDTRTPVAVQANCIEILCYLSVEFDWIKDELVPQIRFLMRDGSAAIQSRGRKILHQLHASEA